MSSLHNEIMKWDNTNEKGVFPASYIFILDLDLLRVVF